ncbi:OVARIAN TUMOR DOMAIN-containing deubiquitinating enzyme 9-like [Alnus glutinosa]|uniref:OVARIAN TUMOR DOMAIN-containing deubiquitinating enzyme 9-like n=1 Tax=Alnus glutinosa TaxID=3517 RepID=UPI002D768EAB|nr:OVARIAN TUMOR DOMAIN-containing deubiquitinating enzyme 9-like [Alnus glutinosa]
MNDIATSVSQTWNSRFESIAKIDADEEKPSPIDWSPQQQYHVEPPSTQSGSDFQIQMLKLMGEINQDLKSQGQAIAKLEAQREQMTKQIEEKELQRQSVVNLDGHYVHVPKTNEQTPSAEEVISDYQRLLERLELYDLEEKKVKGDGNCQFRSLSDQLNGDPKHHKLIRKQVVEQLKSQPELYKNYVPMSYDEYLKKMSNTGEWGDHVTLQAAADRFGSKILLITSFKDTCYIEILPYIQNSEKVLLLNFWADIHYNPIYPKSDLTVSEKGKDKKGGTK